MAEERVATNLPAGLSDESFKVKPSDARSKRRSRCIVPVAVVCTFLITLNAAVALLLIQLNQPHFVVFDMKGTVDAFIDQSVQRPLSSEQKENVSKRFNRALEDSLREYQFSHHALVLVAPAVISGADDITPAIQQSIAARMRDSSDE